MMDIAKNKLWVMQATAEAVKLAEEHPHSYACDDHCLFIGPEGPAGAVEVTEELAQYLTQGDWRWIYSESNGIRQEQEQLYREELKKEQDAFFERFNADLKRTIAEGTGDADCTRRERTDCHASVRTGSQ